MVKTHIELIEALLELERRISLQKFNKTDDSDYCKDLQARAIGIRFALGMRGDTIA